MSAISVEENWQAARSTIRERTAFMFNNNLLSDVKFCVRGSNGGNSQEIHAHKFVLSISSPVFHAMFYGQMAENSSTIILPDCDYEGLLELFRYMYSDEVCLNRNCVMQVLYLAEKYIVPSLVSRCFEYLRENVDESNVFCILTHALRYGEQNACKDLVEHCWETVDNNTEQAILSEEFVTIDRSILEALVERDSLNIKEIDLFQAVNMWAEHQCQKQGCRVTDGTMKRKVIGERIVARIRYPIMDKTEFISVVLDSNILLPSEAFAVIKCFYSACVVAKGFQATRRIGGLRRCQRFDSVLKFGWSNKEGLTEDIYLCVDKDIKMHGVRICGSEGDQQEVVFEVRDSSVEVEYIQKRGTVSSVQLQYKSTRFYGADVLFDQPVDLKKEVVYCIRATFSGSVCWLGENSLEHVHCSGVTFRFSATKQMNGLPRDCKIQREFLEILFTPM